MPDSLVEVNDLKIHFFTDEGVVRAVDGVDLTLKRGQTLCLVGESGCGKSVTSQSLMQIVHPAGKIISGEILYYQKLDDGLGEQEGMHEIVDIAQLNPKGRQIRNIRGKDISMIFQEPMTSLSPMYTVGNQIMETIRLHTSLSKAEARELSIEMLDRVGGGKNSLPPNRFLAGSVGNRVEAHAFHKD